MSVYVDHKLKLTYDDLKQIPEGDPYRHEIYDGIHVASPSPIVAHQRVSQALSHELYSAVQLRGLGEVFSAPLDVELGLYDILEPDIMVVCSGNRDIIHASHIVGVPDLVVEILSPSTAARDRGIKRERYEAAGVPRYWIIDPVARGCEVYRLDHSSGTYGEAALYRDAVPFGCTDHDVVIDLSRLW